MATLEPETGLVVRYRYFWQQAREETGQKARLAVQVPETKRRRL